MNKEDLIELYAEAVADRKILLTALKKVKEMSNDMAVEHWHTLDIRDYANRILEGLK